MIFLHDNQIALIINTLQDCYCQVILNVTFGFVCFILQTIAEVLPNEIEFHLFEENDMVLVSNLKQLANNNHKTVKSVKMDINWQETRGFGSELFQSGYDNQPQV